MLFRGEKQGIITTNAVSSTEGSESDTFVKVLVGSLRIDLILKVGPRFSSDEDSDIVRLDVILFTLELANLSLKVHELVEAFNVLLFHVGNNCWGDDLCWPLFVGKLEDCFHRFLSVQKMKAPEFSHLT